MLFSCWEDSTRSYSLSLSFSFSLSLSLVLVLSLSFVLVLSLSFVLVLSLSLVLVLSLVYVFLVFPWLAGLLRSILSPVRFILNFPRWKDPTFKANSRWTSKQFTPLCVTVLLFCFFLRFSSEEKKEARRYKVAGEGSALSCLLLSLGSAKGNNTTRCIRNHPTTKKKVM